MRRRTRGNAAVFALLALLLLAMSYPLIWMISVSVQGRALYRDGNVNLVPREVTLENYENIFKLPFFGRWVLNSFVVVLAVTAANLVFASMAGFVLARKRFRGRETLMLLILASLMVPRQVLIIPVYLLMLRLNLIGTYPALIFPFAVDAFNIFLMRQYMLNLPTELEESARMDGASDFQILFRIVMPLCLPALAIVGINTFLVNWNSFLYPLILTLGSPRSTWTLPVGLAMYAQDKTLPMSQIVTGAAVATIPVLLAFLLFQKQIIEGLTAGALKE